MSFAPHPFPPQGGSWVIFSLRLIDLNNCIINVLHLLIFAFQDRFQCFKTEHQFSLEIPPLPEFSKNQDISGGGLLSPKGSIHSPRPAGENIKWCNMFATACASGIHSNNGCLQSWPWWRDPCLYPSSTVSLSEQNSLDLTLTCLRNNTTSKIF